MKRIPPEKLEATQQSPLSARIRSSQIQHEYGISRTTMWRLRKEGRIAPVGRIGKKELLYLRAELEEMMASMI